MEDLKKPYQEAIIYGCLFTPTQVVGVPLDYLVFSTCLSLGLMIVTLLINAVTGADSNFHLLAMPFFALLIFIGRRMARKDPEFSTIRFVKYVRIKKTINSPNGNEYHP